MAPHCALPARKRPKSCRGAEAVYYNHADSSYPAQVAEQTLPARYQTKTSDRNNVDALAQPPTRSSKQPLMPWRNQRITARSAATPPKVPANCKPTEQIFNKEGRLNCQTAFFVGITRQQW